MIIHDWFFQQTSQALGFLSLLGVLAAAVRWNRAVRKDILLAFAIYLLGSSVREAVVYYFSGIGWTPGAYFTSGSARVIQLLGVILFLRATLSDHCAPWAQWSLVFLVLFFVAVV